MIFDKKERVDLLICFIRIAGKKTATMRVVNYPIRDKMW